MGLALLPSFATSAAAVELKLSFFTSEKGDTYRYGVKPFVDAVNAEGKGLVTIKVYPDGALGKSLAEQPSMVLEGVADIAWIVPGQTPYRFPDNQLLELPGLFHDVREGTLVYTRLIADNALRGYQDYVVIGAYTSAPSVIHSRKPIEFARCAQGQEGPHQQSDGGGGGRTSRRHPDGYAGIAVVRGAQPRDRRRGHYESGRVVSIRRRAHGGQPLPSRHGRRAAGGAHEPQEIRQLAGSRAGAYPQI